MDRVRARQVLHRRGRILALVGDGGQGEVRIGFRLHVGLQRDDGAGGLVRGVVVLAAHGQRGFQVQ